MSEFYVDTAKVVADMDTEKIREAMARFGRSLAAQGVAAEVTREVRAQEEEWGVQDHPLHPGPDGEGYRLQHDHLMKHWQSLNGYRQTMGQLAWDGILLEEVFEALSETDPEKREQELVQVAAVAVSMILASRRARQERP